MPRVRSHTRSSRKRHKVRAHYRTPPWVGTFLFFVAVIVIAAMVSKAGGR